MKYFYECNTCKSSGSIEEIFEVTEEQYGNTYKCSHCGAEIFEDDLVQFKLYEDEKYNVPLVNYHCHRDDSNILTGGDSIVKPKDYMLRAIELGHPAISSCTHGYQGIYHDVYEHSFYTKCEDCGKILVGHQKECKCGSSNVTKERLKFLYVIEAYWVKSLKDDTKDRANAHMVWIAKTDEGRKQINKLLSYVNEMDYLYYGRPRADLDLIEEYLNPNDVIISSACIGFAKYDNMEEIIERLHNHFGDSMYLEYQCHVNREQSEYNQFLQEMSLKYNIKTIIGLDSHYIYPKQHLERNNYINQKRKNSSYGDDSELGWFMDYPDSKTIFSRLDAQGVLSEEEIFTSLKNTLELLQCEDIVFTKERKMPVPKKYAHLSNKDRAKIFISLIQEKFKEHMAKLKRDKILTEELYDTYKKRIKYELDIIIKGDVADYFLANYDIIKIGQETYGGLVTPTGRGSAPSQYLNYLLGFTKLDAVTHPLTMYPERFLTLDRLKSGQMPD